MNTENTFAGSDSGKAASPLNDLFHQRSEAAQEIISHKPDFFEKWALLLFMAILMFLTAGTWFIRYPDIVNANGKLIAVNAPKEIIARQSGRLTGLLVKNGDTVKKGDIIGWMESTAATSEILDLSGKLDSAIILIAEGNDENVSRLFDKRYSRLGELQMPFQSFTSFLQQYNDYLVNGFYVRKKQMLLRDIETLKQMNSFLETQKGLTRQDEDSSQRTLAMNKILLEKKIISAEEYRIANSKHVSKQMAIPQLNASILNNQSQQREKLKEIEQLNHDVSQQKLIFEQALQTLKSSLDDWMRQYVLQSHIDGVVIFSMPLQQNKFIEQGRLLGYITPPNNKYYIELTLPQNNLGKVENGMQVQLRFDAYPYQEAGFVKGRLDYVSPIASDTGFLASVRLQNGLQTNLNKTIQYKNGLRAEALIITKDMRLLERMYYSVVKSVSPGK